MKTEIPVRRDWRLRGNLGMVYWHHCCFVSERRSEARAFTPGAFLYYGQPANCSETEIAAETSRDTIIRGEHRAANPAVPSEGKASTAARRPTLRPHPGFAVLCARGRTGVRRLPCQRREAGFLLDVDEEMVWSLVFVDHDSVTACSGIRCRNHPMRLVDHGHRSSLLQPTPASGAH